MSKSENPNQGQEIEVISIDQREIELLEKNRKINLQKLFTPEGMDLIISEIQKEVADFSADISTKDGRAKIISMAAKVAKCKSPIKNLASELKEESRRLIDGVNAQWNRYESAMDTLRDQIRKPVDEIEEREAKQLEERQNRLGLIENLRNYIPDSGFQKMSESYANAIKRAEDLIQFENWGEFQFKAETSFKEIYELLQQRIAAAIKNEEEQAELAKLRKEAAERTQKDHEEKIAREAAEKAKREAEEAAERERKAAIEREAKIEADKKAAEDRANESERLRLEQEATAKHKKVIDDRISELSLLGMIYNGTHESFLFEDVNVPLLDVKLLTQEEWIDLMQKIEPVIKQRKIAAAEKEKQRIADEAVEKERKRVAEEKRKEDEAAEKREANIRHRGKINSAAALDLACHVMNDKGVSILDEDTAKRIVAAIAKGWIGNVQINY